MVCTVHLTAQLAIRCINANYYCNGAVTLKGSHRMGGGRIILITSAPLSLINTYRISLISAGSISLDSTFKHTLQHAQLLKISPAFISLLMCLECFFDLGSVLGHHYDDICWLWRYFPHHLVWKTGGIRLVLFVLISAAEERSITSLFFSVY
jgi:hypothetical protein